MNLESIAWLMSCAAAVVSIVTPIVRLNVSVARLTASLEALVVRLERTEAILDEYDERIVRAECDTAALEKSVTQIEDRLDRLTEK